MKEEPEPIGKAIMEEFIRHSESYLESKIERLKQIKAELKEVERENDEKIIKLHKNEITKYENSIERDKQQIKDQKKLIAI